MEKKQHYFRKLKRYNSGIGVLKLESGLQTPILKNETTNYTSLNRNPNTDLETKLHPQIPVS